MAGKTFDDLVSESHYGWGEFIKGDPVPAENLFSRAPDVSNANPFGPVARGWDNVVQTMERAASFYREGEVVGFDTARAAATPPARGAAPPGWRCAAADRVWRPACTGA